MADLAGYRDARSAAPRWTPTRWALTGLLAALVAVCVAAPGAQAATGYLYGGSFAGACGVVAAPACPSDGLFSNSTLPQRMVVHQQSGKLFVADTAANRIQVFSPTPTGAAFSYSIPVSKPFAVAIDQSNGDLYVVRLPVSPSPGGVSKFNADSSADPTAYTVDATFTSPVEGAGATQVTSFGTGTAQSANRGGIAVDPTSGDILVMDRGKQMIHRFSSAGAHKASYNGAHVPSGRAAFANLMDFGVTPTGQIIVSEQISLLPRIDRYDANGVLLANISRAGFQEIPTNTLSTNATILAIDPSTGEIFARRKGAGGSFSPDDPGHIYHFDGNDLVGVLGVPGDGLHGITTGLAVHAGASGRLYALSTQTTDMFGAAPIPAVQFFNAIRPPSVAIDPVAGVGVTATSAAVAGTVNPNGSSTDWRFEYRRAGIDSGWPNHTDWQSVGDGTDDVPVSATLTDLDPNTAYELRLSARTDTDLNASSDSASFTTLKAAPLIGLTTAGFFTDVSARLTAEVNPRSAATSYWFEYGTTTDYSHRVPVAPAAGDAGDGRVLARVSQSVAGLQAGTTYHYRVVAVNDADQRTDGPDRTFNTLVNSKGGLQGQRGYELATLQPAQSSIGSTPDPFVASEDGKALSYRIRATEPLPPGVEVPHRVIRGDRGDGAWDFSFIDLPNAERHSNGQPSYPSHDFSRVFVETTVGHDPDDQNDIGDLYHGGDLYLLEPGKAPIWLTRSELVPPGEPQTDTSLIGITRGQVSAHVAERRIEIASPASSAVSRKGEAVVFGSRRQLTLDDPNPSSPAHGAGANRLYKWSGGELTLISVRPNGTAPTGREVVLGSDVYPAPALVGINSPHAVSRDGSRVFWSDGSTLFVHVEGEGSKTIGAGVYVDATPDGSRAFYTSGGRLYAYDVADDESHDLTGTGVLGTVAVAETGRKVYFVSTTALDAESSPLGRRPVSESPNLYVRDIDGDGAVGRTRLVAVLGSGAHDPLAWAPRIIERKASVSPDGVVLAFGSPAALVDGRQTAGVIQAYVYDDEANSLACVSCPADGSAPVDRHVNQGISASGGDLTDPAGAWNSDEADKRLVSSDGTVFFDTATTLVPGDHNRERDAYEYRNGQLRLLVPGGAADGNSVIKGASVDGSTVFVASSLALDPRDTSPGMRKLWALPVGGGFSYSAPAPRCLLESCGAASEPDPPPPTVATEGYVGTGDLVPARPTSATLSLARVRSLPRRAVVRVRVVAPGRIAFAGPKIRRASRPLAKAGAHDVRLVLTPRARRQLARRGAMSIRVRATFWPRAGRAVTKTIVFKLRKGKPGRGVGTTSATVDRNGDQG